MGGLKSNDKITKDQVLFYMTQSASTLPRHAAVSIAKHASTRHFLLFLAKNAPVQIKKLAETVRREASKAKQNEKMNNAKKRAALTQGGGTQQNKRAKTSGGDEKNRFGDAESEALFSRSRGSRGAPPPYSASPQKNCDSDESSDDGVELAKDEQEQESDDEENEAGEHEEEEEDDEEIRAEECEEEGDSEDETQVQKQGGRVRKADGVKRQKRLEMAKEDSEGVIPIQRSATPFWVENLQHLEIRGIGAPDQHPLERQMQEQAKHLLQTMPSKEHFEQRLELGLTRGEPWVQWLIRKGSMTLQVPAEDPIFEICKKLDFTRNKMDLINFHRNQRRHIGIAKLKGPLPSTCDPNHPYELYDNIMANEAIGEVAGINRTYGQLRLCKLVEQLAPNNTRSNRNQILADLAIKKPNDLSQEEKKSRIEKFKAEYQAGAKWKTVATVFGGDEVILIFAAANIGLQMIGKSLRLDQHDALKELSRYLNGTKKLVGCLGSGSLEYFCRNGCLSKKKIAELEGLEADSPDEEVSDDRVETEDEVED